MSTLPKTLNAGAAVLLLLGGVVGAAATPSKDARLATDTSPESSLQQVARPGKPPAAAEAREEHPERSVRIAAFSWSKALADQLIHADLTIESALPFALKAVEIACVQFARTGVEIDSDRRTIAELVPARGRLQVTALDLGPIHPRAGSSSCRVVGVALA
ncbi:MAG TPA: hypothetical protein VLE23_10570 [Geminicoccaceae bacterium]|nr:hypothetical protein [Geminicoccaceae bacterium]